MYLALFCAALYALAFGMRGAREAYCSKARASFLAECNAVHSRGDCSADFDSARPYCGGR